MALKNLSPAHVQAFYRDRLDSGLTPATVPQSTLSGSEVVFDTSQCHCVRQGPEVRSRRDKATYREQTKTLLEAAHGDRFEALYVLAVTTGLRRGELLDLRWDELDLAQDPLRVKRTLTRRKGHLLLGEPKTKKSRRTVQLTDTAVETLRGHLTRQMEQIERLGDLYKDQGFVFATEKGTLVNPTNLRKRSSEPLLEKAELPHIRFHDLRHTCATLLFWSTINPKIVSEMLGHANVAITLDTYAHVLPTMQDNATRALEDCSRRRAALVGCSTVAVRGPEYVLGSLLNS
jgi:integrase